MLGLFVDIETTGTNPFIHRPIEFAMKVVDLSTGTSLTSYNSIISQPSDVWAKSNPESLKINGFSFEEVSKGAPLETVSQDVISLFKEWKLYRDQAVFICQNPSFDRMFFAYIVDPGIQEKFRWPYYWLDLASMYWQKSISNHQMTPPWRSGFSKDKIAAIFHLPPEANPHRALNGVNHLILCYEAVVGFPKRVS